VPHHLLDVVEPTEAYSAARFAKEARESIAKIRARGRMPILAGGTMLYFKALTDGLSDLPAADVDTRAAIDEEARLRGWTALHAELARVDPASAARLQPGDRQRIQRALEVWRMTGTPLSSLQGRRSAEALGPSLSLALLPEDRARLHEAIAQRFDAMLAAGLVDELAALRKRHPLDPAMPSMRAVGYRQAWRYLDGAIDATGLRASGIAATRQLGKRQLTWLRSIRATRFDPFAGEPADAVLREVARVLSP
jgi:tRNA dimethylallyltransferase